MSLSVAVALMSQHTLPCQVFSLSLHFLLDVKTVLAHDVYVSKWQPASEEQGNDNRDDT